MYIRDEYLCSREHRGNRFRNKPASDADRPNYALYALPPIPRSLLLALNIDVSIVPTDVYLGMQLAVIPTFLAEISPAHLRGGMGVLYWLSIKVYPSIPNGLSFFLLLQRV